MCTQQRFCAKKLTPWQLILMMNMESRNLPTENNYDRSVVRYRPAGPRVTPRTIAQPLKAEVFNTSQSV
jgi:hypothetical protein